jgi:aspartate aminotransferase
MINEAMKELGNKRSIIREIFEYSKQREKIVGKENVFNFSIGNPSVPAPEIVNETIADLAQNFDSIELHGYTSAQGDIEVRTAISQYIKTQYGADVSPNHIYMTMGASAGLAISFKALCVPDDEIIIFAPYFPEYRVFASFNGVKSVSVKPSANLQPDLEDFAAKITPKTKAVVINSPNNPSGVIYTEETIKTICSILTQKQKEYGHPIYIISDEPYRELVYEDIKVPYILNYYNNTLVCYSFSKSLSIPGERIGYIAVNPNMENCNDVYAAVCGAGRALGYVCASSLFQRVAAKCLGKIADTSIYKTNRDLLYNALKEYGYDCIYPDGAFYLFVKTPIADSIEFCEKAKKYELMLVPADSFGAPGFVRIAYCVTTQQIERSLPAFKKLAQECLNT